MFIDPELGGPLTRLELDRHDLLVEPARLNRCLSAAMGLQRELVLGVARDPMRLAHVLGSHPHMNLIEWIG